LEYAFQRTDYLFLFDADDTIHGQVVLPPVMTSDAYLFKFRTVGGTYIRPLLITNRKPWLYRGVVHEFLDSNESRHGNIVDGNYFIESGRTGARSLNPNKYLEDAKMIEKELLVETNEKLRLRYMYFCGQSYRDHGDVDNSILWYRTFLKENNGETDDKYAACLNLSELYKTKNDTLNMIHFLSISTQVDPSRIEGVITLMNLFFQNENHMMVNLLYHKFKKYSKETQILKTYYQEVLYDYQVEALNSVSAFLVGDIASGYECCKKVIVHSKQTNHVSLCMENIHRMYSAQYNKDPVMKAIVERKPTSR
jgi:hypothetical protein